MPPLRPQTVLPMITITALFALSASSHNLHYTNRFLDLKEPNLVSNTNNDNDTANISTTSPNHHHKHKHRHKHGLRHGHGHIHHLPSHEFLKAHNKVRVGFGETPLIWNKTLARYARRWAAKRAFDCQMIHSYGPYGENIFWGGKNHWSPADVVRSWIDEYKFYDSLSNVCEPGQMCGHYTQVVWRETSRLGCARVRCLRGGVFVVCNYDPPGNFVGESPFSGAGGSNVDPPAPEMSGDATAQQPPDEAQTALGNHHGVTQVVGYLNSSLPVGKRSRVQVPHGGFIITIFTRGAFAVVFEGLFHIIIILQTALGTTKG